MAVTGAPGGSKTLHATAYLDATNTEVDTNAVISWRSDNETVATVTDLGSTGGVGQCSVSLVGDGTGNIIATATNPDGSTKDSLPEPVDVVTPPAPEPTTADAQNVVITD